MLLSLRMGGGVDVSAYGKRICGSALESVQMLWLLHSY